MGRGGAAKTHQAIMEESDFGVPDVDSAGNVDWGDVIGNKSDTVGGTSLVALIKSAGGGSDSHLPLFTGNIYYVAADRPDDTGNGQTPATAKKTVLAGIALMSAGDRLTVKAGTYDENGMALTLTGQELICEAGAIFVNSTPGTVLTVSGLGCVIRGAHFVQAGACGLCVTGIGAIIDQCIAVNCTVGFDIDQHSTQMFTCVAAGSTVTAFDIGAQNTTLRECFAPGTGAATRGFYLSAAAVTRSLLDQCHSVGNATAGFETVAGADGNTISYSSSGGGDGRRVDAGEDNVWPNYSPNEHALLFGGTVWYVDGTNGANTNDGLTPTTARLTIASAEASMSAGDAINIRAGTYTEDVTVNNAAAELWGEIGAVMVGTLTVSADSCRVRGMIIAPAAAVGLALTGNRCKIEDVQVVGTPTTAFDIDGYQNIIFNTKAAGYTATGYDVANYNTHIKDAIAQGDGGARRGYYFSAAAADDCTLENCISAKNATSSFEFVTGAEGTTINGCSSGAGDGRWIDTDEAQVWNDDFHFADYIEKVNTLSVVGAATETYNLFKVTGSVMLKTIVGVVETALTGTNTDTFLDLFSANGSVLLTENTPGEDLGALLVGSVIAKVDESDQQLAVGSAAGPAAIEEVDAKGEAVRIVEDRTGAAHVATYVRFTHTCAAGGTGEIHWYAHWEPVSDDGWLATV